MQESTVNLHDYAQDGDVDQLESALQGVTEIQGHCDLAGMTLLHKAVIFQKPEVVQFLTNHANCQQLISCTDHVSQLDCHICNDLDK